MWLTAEPPDLTVYQLDNIAEIRPWITAEQRSEEAASVQLQDLPPTRWLRELWSAAQLSPQPGWDCLPDDIIESWGRGERLDDRDLAFLVQMAGGRALEAASAATRTLGLLVDAQPSLEREIIPVLERGLKHAAAAIRGASGEAIWIAEGRGSVQAIRQAASKEQDARVREYLLHAAQLLSKE